MKKSILICGLALVGFTSCKKTWTCDCALTSSGITTNLPYTIPDQRKSDAKTQCENYDETFDALYSTDTDIGVDCELK